MKNRGKGISGRRVAACLAGIAVLALAGCGEKDNLKNLIKSENEEERVVNMFSPMEKTAPDAENTARSASDLTVAMAEEALGVTVAYKTYTAEDHQDKTYDEVALDRARNDMDDLYLLNPDTGGGREADGPLRAGQREEPEGNHQDRQHGGREAGGYSPGGGGLRPVRQ